MSNVGTGRFAFAVALAGLFAAEGAPQYDLLLKGGHVIDPKNGVNRVADVAIAGGKIARVAPDIPAERAAKAIDVSGLYVTPGLVDIHAHVATSYDWKLTGDDLLSVQADAFSFRSGVTTMVDAGSTGARDFGAFNEQVIRHSQTRVLALLNISRLGMGPGREDDPADLDAEAAARMAQAHPGVIVGFKSAHYAGPGWVSVDRAVAAGRLAKLPVMVDFGYLGEERTLSELLLKRLRPGDIYTHCYSGHRGEMGPDGKLAQIMRDARKRGIIFDAGHGGGSFYWYVALAAVEEGFFPDSISTDVHTGSMNAGMKDMTNVMSKFLILGAPLDAVIRMSTSEPAREIQRPDLGNLDTGAEADVAVLRVDRGPHGFLDSAGARFEGSQLLVAELTLRKGKVMWDLNGRAGSDWKSFAYDKRLWVKPRK